jgi:hypothetical protein
MRCVLEFWSVMHICVACSIGWGGQDECEAVGIEE